MLQHLYYPISALMSVKREVKNNGKFQTFGSKNGRGRLREVVATRGSKCSYLTWKLLVFWNTGR